MPSKTVSKKWKSCMFVVTAYKVHRDPLLTGIAEISRKAPLPTQPVTDEDGAVVESPQVASTFFFQPETISIDEAKEKVGWFLDSVVDAMERRAVAMVGADEINLGEVDEGSAIREDRSEAASDLRVQYVRQRDVLIKLYDEKVARAAGFETNVEQEPSPLTLQVRRAINGLKSGKVQFAEGFGHIMIDPIKYALELEPKLERLEKILLNIDIEVRQTEGTIQAKTEAIQAHDRLFTPGAQALEVAFKLAGMPELAKKVKPSVRRVGSRVEEVEAEENGREATGFEFLGVPEPPLPEAVLPEAVLPEAVLAEKLNEESKEVPKQV